MSAFYIDVILPLALRGVFTYSVPEAWREEVGEGKRVVVPFGAKRLYSAVVYRIGVEPRKGTKPKAIAYVLDAQPIVTAGQLRFWEWMASYYMSGLGAVMLAALPGAMRLSSQTLVMAVDNADYDDSLDPHDRMLLVNLIGREAIAVDTLEKLSTKAATQRSLDKLLKLGLVDLREEMQEQVKPKTQVFIDLSEDFRNEKVLSETMDNLLQAPKQLETLMRWTELSGYFSGEQSAVPKARLMAATGASAAIVRSLVSRGVFVERERAQMSDEELGESGKAELAPAQKNALDEVLEHWHTKTTALLHGVTGSGKTLVYAELIKTKIAQGGQVLYLVPEIALTTQLVARLKHLLGMEVMVYHSRYSNRERLTMWMQMLGDQQPRVIVGARSAVFLPFRDLKLVIVDEEHESSYKQHEAAPYYHARDAAIWLGANTGAKVLLGSATPSVESLYNADRGKFGKAVLSERFGNIKMPTIELVDLRKDTANKAMKSGFAPLAFDRITEVLKHKRQVIVFQNRRGYAPYQMCESCGWAAECDNCDVNLTYHRFFEKLLCHYCGFSLKQPTHCPGCGSAKLKVKGSGTEKTEDDLEILFPTARIARMDLDTTRKKQSLQNIVNAFEEGSVDILVGTQMVTKGLDFENVALVVVMNADSLWCRPDFRAFERAFQMLTQVAGRAGRKRERGHVVIQTYRPDHPVLAHVMQNSHRLLFEQQLTERRQFDYPPFTRLIKIQLAHPDAKLVRDAANFMATELRAVFGKRLLGPEEPPVARLRGRYLRQMYLKLDPATGLEQAKRAVWRCVDALEGHTEYRRVRLAIDVDPL